MARRLSVLAVALAFIGLSVPSHAQAQGSLYLQGGATFPSSEYGDFAKTGWMAIGGYVFDVSGGIALGVEGFYGQNSHDDYDITGTLSTGALFSSVAGAAAGDRTDLYGGMGTVSYFFNLDSSLTPYVFGGAGYMVHKYVTDISGLSGSEGSFAWEFGGGVGFPLSESIDLYGEGRYMAGTGDISGTKLWGLFAGLAFNM